MKRCLVLGVLLTFLSSAALHAAEPVRVVDSTRTVSVALPQGWSAIDNPPLGATLHIIDLRPNGFRTNINVFAEEVGSLALADYVKIALRNCPKLLPRFKLLTSRKTKLAGIAAHEITYTAIVAGRQLKFKAVIAVRRGAGYTVTYTAEPTRYKKDLSVFSSVLKSLKWM